MAKQRALMVFFLDRLLAAKEGIGTSTAQRLLTLSKRPNNTNRRTAQSKH
jgi:hypothetical protein